MSDRPDQLDDIDHTITVTFDIYMDADGEAIGVRRAVNTDTGEEWSAHAVLFVLTDFARDLLAGDVEEAASAQAGNSLPAGIHVLPTVGEA